MICGNSNQAVFIFVLAWADIRLFSKFSGLHVNCKKFAIFRKGHWTELRKVQLLGTGLPIEDSYKYLGIQFGGVTTQKSYSHALQEAMARAFTMQTWTLSLPARIHLLKLRILPLFVYTVRVIFSSAGVASTYASV